MKKSNTKSLSSEGTTPAETEMLGKSPAFQCYVRDWLTHPTLAGLSHAEFGFLMRLIFFLWLEENLIFNEKNLARLMHVTPKKFQILFAPMKTFFEIQDGFIRCPQLEAERQKQANWRAKSALGGQKSAEAKRKGGTKMVATNGQPNANTASSSSSSSATAEEDSLSTAEDNSLSLANAHSLSPFSDEKDDGAARRTLEESFDFIRKKFSTVKPNVKFNQLDKTAIRECKYGGFSDEQIANLLCFAWVWKTERGESLQQFLPNVLEREQFNFFQSAARVALNPQPAEPSA